MRWCVANKSLKRKIEMSLAFAIVIGACAGCGLESMQTINRPESEVNEPNVESVGSISELRDSKALIQIYENAVNQYGTISNANYNGNNYLDNGSGVIAPFLCDINGNYALIILRQEDDGLPVLVQEVYVENPVNTWTMISKEQVLTAGINGSDYRVIRNHSEGNLSMASYQRAGEDNWNMIYQLGGSSINSIESSGQSLESIISIDGSNGLFIPDFDASQMRNAFYDDVKVYAMSAPSNNSASGNDDSENTSDGAEVQQPNIAGGMLTENTGSCKSNAEKAGMIYVAQKAYGWNPYFDETKWGKHVGKVDSGCNIACISMAASSLGINYTPEQLIDLNGSEYWNDSTYSSIGIRNAYHKSFSDAGGQEQENAVQYLDECLQRFSDNPGEVSPPRISIVFGSGTRHYLLIVGKSADGSYICVDSNLDYRATFAPVEYSYSQDKTGYTSYITGITQYTK